MIGVLHQLYADKLLTEDQLNELIREIKNEN